MANTRIVLTSARAGGLPERTLSRSFTVSSVGLMLNARIAEERRVRASRGEAPGPVTVRAWRVTPAGTYIFPPIMELEG